MGAFRNLHANTGSYSVQKHQRLLQICGPNLQPLCVEFVKPSFFESTARENGGFGSTGL
jgi:dUTPase